MIGKVLLPAAIDEAGDDDRLTRTVEDEVCLLVP